jgi:hypothetical protein
MKTPYFLAEHGYRPDPANPMRFVNPLGHPWHPVTLEHERQHNGGECVAAIARAAYDAGVDALAALQEDIRKPQATPPATDPQCDGCRWKKQRVLEGVPAEIIHCVMHRQRVENCPHQEIEHAKPLLKPYAVGICPRDGNPCENAGDGSQCCGEGQE